MNCRAEWVRVNCKVDQSDFASCGVEWSRVDNCGLGYRGRDKSAMERSNDD